MTRKTKNNGDTQATIMYCVARNMRGIIRKMIRSFSDAATHALFLEGQHRKFANIAAVALRKLDQMQSALFLNDLKEPPGNRLEALKGNRAGQHSIRINKQFRICFLWKPDGAHDVEITDYH